MCATSMSDFENWRLRVGRYLSSHGCLRLCLECSGIFHFRTWKQLLGTWGFSSEEFLLHRLSTICSLGKEGNKKAAQGFHAASLSDT